MPTGEELNDRVRAVAECGDREAFAVLFRHFAPRVKAYLVRAGASPEVAEELTQETMVLVWRKAASFDPARAGLATWIYTIARHVRIDRLRRHGHTVLDAEDLHEDAGALADGLPDTAVALDERLIAGQREREVHDALAKLSAEQLSVLKLCYFDDQPHTQIARELSIPLGTVKSRIRLAVHRLRRLMEGFDG